MEILAVRDLSFTYPQCDERALKDVSFTVERGEFVILCGATGSGKTTLLRTLKRELTPYGEMTGEIVFSGRSLDSLTERESASLIGYVMQKPEQQIVTDKVWHELAFGLENLGVPSSDIARRCAEMASYFGIVDWYDRDISELSGGQKQLLNLASILVMQPEVLILDEPTAMLDPIAAMDFISTLKRLNRELALTIIMVEHRLEDAVSECDRLIILEKGSVIANGRPSEVIPEISSRSDIICGMPAAARLFTRLDMKGECPLTVRQGRELIENNFGCAVKRLHSESKVLDSEAALEFREVYFRYDRYSRDILQGLDLKVSRGEILCILGGNGSGKTTALGAAAGLLKIYSGNIRVFGKKLKDYKNRSLYRECLALLPQDVQTVFLKNTVQEELDECGADLGVLPFDISHLLKKHPYDLSGGEQQLAALAKVLAAKPKLLLLDEPTKGLDASAKLRIMDILHSLRDSGVTIVTVTHDVEFAALCADRCAMFFGGRIVSESEPRDFFSENSFYTTAVSRMTRGYYENAVTVEDAAALCSLNSESVAEK